MEKKPACYGAFQWLPNTEMFVDFFSDLNIPHVIPIRFGECS